MREPPDILDEHLIASVWAKYNISVVSLVFLPVGHDSSAWVYRVDATDGATYFLKIRKGPIYEPGLVVPRYLRDLGIAHVIAPLPTTDRTLWTGLGDFGLMLYPYVDGRTGMDVGLTEDQWITFGRTVRQIHTTPLTRELVTLVGTAPFSPRWGGATRDWEDARNLDAHVAAGPFTDPTERELSAFWLARAHEIRALIDRAEDLGERLRREALQYVLCHADLHTGNVLIDADQHLWIVDWDETALAPKERDLMFVVSGISRELVGPREERLFFQGYGDMVIDPLALSYYRYAWAVQDISDFGEQVFSGPNVGAITKRAAAEGFKSLFEPGSIVELAYESDHASL